VDQCNQMGLLVKEKDSVKMSYLCNSNRSFTIKVLEVCRISTMTMWVNRHTSKGLTSIINEVVGFYLSHHDSSLQQVSRTSTDTGNRRSPKTSVSSLWKRLLFVHDSDFLGFQSNHTGLQPLSAIVADGQDIEEKLRYPYAYHQRIPDVYGERLQCIGSGRNTIAMLGAHCTTHVLFDLDGGSTTICLLSTKARAQARRNGDPISHLPISAFELGVHCLHKHRFVICDIGPPSVQWNDILSIYACCRHIWLAAVLKCPAFNFQGRFGPDGKYIELQRLVLSSFEEYFEAYCMLEITGTPYQSLESLWRSDKEEPVLLYMRAFLMDLVVLLDMSVSS